MPLRPPRPNNNGQPPGASHVATGRKTQKDNVTQGYSASDNKPQRATATEHQPVKHHAPETEKNKSPYQLHVENWSDCTKCFLHEHRTKVVLARGKLPCDVLFIGEAPGKTEDIAGSPFVGRAGELLNQIIDRSVPKEVRYALTNLIACIPLNDNLEKTTEPPIEAVQACTPRLLEIIELASPKLVVCVGKEAKEWLNQRYSWCIPCKVPMTDILHPAAILRANYVHQGLLTQKAIVAIGTALDEYVNSG